MAVVPAHCGRYEVVHSRREFLAKSAFGFGMLGLGDLLARQARGDAETSGGRGSSRAAEPGSAGYAGVPASPSRTQPLHGDPLAPRPPHFPAKAKSVIFLFMTGGPSHLETFDPKPLLR